MLESFTLIDVDKFIYKYSLEGLAKKELYSTISFLTRLLFQALKGNGYLRIPIAEINSYFSLSSKGYKEKTLAIYQFIDVDENYHFNLLYPQDNISKGYRLKYEFFMEILDQLILPEYLKVTKEKILVKRYLHQNNLYKTKKEIKEKFNMKRKELDSLQMVEYYSLFTEPINRKKKDIELKTNERFDAMHYVIWNEEYMNEQYLKLRAEYNGNGDLEMETTITWLGITKKVLERNPQLGYTRSKFGRLFNRTQGFGYASLQNASKAMRKIIFQGQYEYDIATSVASILTQHLTKINIDKYYPYIESYISDKDFYRNKIIELGFEEKQAKQYLTSLFFGIDVENLHSQSKLYKAFSKEELDTILLDESIKELVAECLDLNETLQEYYKRQCKFDGEWIIRNELGNTLRFTEWKKFKSKVISFIYQGIEAKILDVIRERMSVNLLLFDAFISEESVDVNFLRVLCYDNTGYYVNWEKTFLV